MRLQKYLADKGVASRRKSEELIKKGIVKVNGTVVTEMGRIIDPEKDRVTVNNKELSAEKEKHYILLNKPKGYITTASDQFNRKKVTDLIRLPCRLYPVGRLDYNTSGLLILTNDGELAFKLTHPKFKTEKTYWAKIKGIPDNKKLEAFRQGLQVEDYVTLPAKIKILTSEHKTSTVEIVVKEGKNRQIRKMCEAIGHPVIELKRIAVGKLYIGSLEPAEWRTLTPEEVGYLKNL